jgi:hypothetical protein
LSAAGRTPSCFKLSVLPLPGALAFFTWILRGILLSGYPAYPSTCGGLDVPWRIPASLATNETIWIRSWARWPSHSPEEVLGQWQWLAPWTKSLFLNNQNWIRVLLPLAMILFGLLLFLLFNKRLDFPHRRRIALFLLPAVCGLLFWFFTAPSPRFLGASLFIFATGLIVTVIPAFSPSLQRLATFFLIFYCAMLIFAAVHFTGWFVERLSPVPEAELVSRKSAGGLVVHVPRSGDQCWDAPLPCAPRFDPRLRLRHSPDLARGFYLEPNSP